jgi:cation:H+ antiporter
VFNLLILALLDALHRERSVYAQAAAGHVLTAGFGIVLIGVSGASILLSGEGVDWRIGHVGAYTPLIVLIYAVAVRTVFQYESKQVREYTDAEPDRYPGLSLRRAWLRYLGAAVVVVAAGIWLPFVAQDLAVVMGWGQGFVGTLFVALATSVPELVVTLSALRIGALDLAVGNLLGSNLFNIVILAVDDLVYLDGPLLGHIDPIHAVSAFSAVIMSGLVMIGLFYRPRSRPLLRIGWVSAGLVLIFGLNAYVAYHFEGLP